MIYVALLSHNVLEKNVGKFYVGPYCLHKSSNFLVVRLQVASFNINKYNN